MLEWNIVSFIKGGKLLGTSKFQTVLQDK